jgi:hypothetical protein
MPIAHFYLSNIYPAQELLDSIVVEWAEEIGVSIKDINITLIESKFQSGNKYKIMANLYLPSLWEIEAISHVQISLLKLLIKRLNLKSEDVFIMTSIIQSGNVVENGMVTKW